MTMTRRDFIKASMATVTAGCASVPATTARRPNVVIIMADDLGYGDLACYGNTRNASPNIDRLAAEGLRFTDFHSNGPMCSPSRAALLTGLYQHRFGREFESALSDKPPYIGLPTDTVTMAQVFKQAGYATGMYGKWHLGVKREQMPTRFGFDDFRGLLTGDGDHISHINRSGEEDWYHNESIAMEEGYAADLITKHSIEFIRANRDNPFFLYVPHLAIHFPWQAPGEAAHRSVGTDYSSLVKLGPHPEGTVAPVVREMIAALDRSVGAIVAELKALNLDRNTLVLFISDNGGYLAYEGRFRGEISSNGACRGQKGEVWEGGHRVPAIAWWPGRIDAGEVTHETVMGMDLFPTCAELAGVRAPSNLDGCSIAPLLLRGRSAPERDLFWRKDTLWAARRGRWKVVGQGEQFGLYDLETDLGESTDVSATHAELTRDLVDRFKAWEQDVDRG